MMRDFFDDGKFHLFKVALFTAILCVASVPGRTPEASDLILKKGDKIAIVGDSITEQRLYSKFIEMYLLVSVPELDLKMMQFGWGGERAPGFVNRIENDLMPWKPNVITTCYGMNDGRYREYGDSIGVVYKENMFKIVDRLKGTGATVVVGSPGAVDSYTYERTGRRRLTTATVYNENLAQLGVIAKSVAEENGMPFANIHGAMMTAMQKAKAIYGEEYHVAGRDGVHPRANGLNGEIGTIKMNWKGKTTATRGHQVLSVSQGIIEIESSRYPFCFYGEDKDPDGTAGILPFVPFQDDMNRFMLAIKNFPFEQAEVKWGMVQKSFTRDQLAKGINLSAEFLDNPFCAPFFEVMDMVAKKQRYETFMIKSLISDFRSLRKEFPNDDDVKEAMDVLQRKLMNRHDERHAEVRAAVKPVRHVISIIPKK
jgi:lysophospholipase L1-like esterase